MTSNLFWLVVLSALLPLRAMTANFDVENVQVEQYNDVVIRTGKLDFKRTLNLSFKSSGYLTKLSVDEGEYFEKEQLLASLETVELKEQKNAAYAQLLQAKREVNRIEKLIASELSSEQALDNAKTQVETTRANYQIAYYNLEKAQIKAPFSGVVLARFSDLGELQSPGREVLKVAALKDNWVVKVALTGTEIGQVRLNQVVDVRLHSLGKVKGVITKVPIIANTDSQLFLIDVLLPDVMLNSGVVAGQIAEVRIDFASNKFVYRVPIEALMAVDENGRALIVTQISENERAVQQAFDIFKIDNEYVYLIANKSDQSLNIVTRGWQHISLGKQ